MAFLDDIAGLFGIDKAELITRQVSSLTPNQQGVEQAIGQTVLGQTGGPPIGLPGRVAPGPFAAGPSALQQQSFQQAPGVAQGVQQNLQGIANPQGPNPIDTVLAGGQGFLDERLGQVASQFGAANATSSSGARDAMNRVLEQFALASQAQALPFAQNQTQQQLQANMGQLDVQNFLAQLGGQQRGIQGEQLLGERQRFDLADPNRSSQAQLGMSLLGGDFADTAAFWDTPSGGDQLSGAFLSSALGAGALTGLNPFNNNSTAAGGNQTIQDIVGALIGGGAKLTGLDALPSYLSGNTDFRGSVNSPSFLTNLQPQSFLSGPPSQNVQPFAPSYSAYTQQFSPAISPSQNVQPPPNIPPTGSAAWSQGITGSDKRLKKNIKTIGHIAGVRFVRWTWRDIAKEFGLTGDSVGVIAQEIIGRYPDCVTTIGQYLAVRYDRLITKLQAA